MTDNNIAVIHDGCKDTPGGAAKVSVEIARVLDADLYVGRTGCLEWYEERVPGFVHVYARYANRLPSFLRDAMVAYRTGKLHLPEYDVVITSGVPAKFYQPESFQRHVHYTHHPPLWYAQWLARDDLGGVRGNIRYIIRKVGMYLDWLEMQRVNSILANSQTTQNRISRHYHRESTVVNPPIEYSEAPVVPRDQREEFFLYAGRLDGRKRLETLVRAFGETDRQLVIAGDGPLREKLERLTAEVGASVEFRGFVDDAELELLMRTASCGVFIPQEEDFGMAIAELLCWGTPVIVSDEPNPRHMISELNGIRIEPAVESLQSAIAEFDVDYYDMASIAREARDQYGRGRFERQIKNIVDGPAEP